MQYITVFDVVRDGFTSWWFPASGLILVVGGAGLVAYRRRHADPRHGTWQRVFPKLFLGFAVFWTLTSFGGTYAEYAHLRNALLAGDYRPVEGVITNFKPAPAEGHADGGVLREGLRVRIADVGGRIARLEVAAGQLRDGTP